METINRDEEAAPPTGMTIRGQQLAVSTSRE